MNLRPSGHEAIECFSKQDRPFILRSRLPAEPRSHAIGTIPVDPSDDAGDGGGISEGVSPASRTTDPNSHTPVGVRLAADHRTSHLQCKENHRHRSGYVDNSLARVLAHTHRATTTALSSRNPMVDPKPNFAASDGVAFRNSESLRFRVCVAMERNHDV